MQRARRARALIVMTVLAAGALAGGCVAAVPPAVVVTGYALDSASNVVTGKTVTDHALSQMVDQDCAMWRMLRLEAPCRPYEEGGSGVRLVRRGPHPEISDRR